MRDAVHATLLETAGSVSQAAKLLGRNRTEFYRVLEKLGINPALYRGIA